ncbi:MAG: exonuclease subunit SbcD [Acidimicrobiia bacterium]|nr:exonuclease subunit SbcD [Acidimicrobiia bacterium]
MHDDRAARRREASVRILHTSDWHVGKLLRGASRADEHRAVLVEIAELARREEIDLILVGGDLFETAAPGPEAEEIVYRALLDLAETAEVAVIAGNHDNARRLRAVSPLLGLGRVRLVSAPTRPEDGGVIDVTTEHGEVARLAMLPFVSQRGIVRADDLVAGGTDERSPKYRACRPGRRGAVRVVRRRHREPRARPPDGRRRRAGWR